MRAGCHVVQEHSRVSPSSRTMLLIYAAHIYLCMYTVRVRYTRSRSLASTAPESRIEGTGSCREVCSTYVIHERTNERLGRRPSALVAETRWRLKRTIALRCLWNLWFSVSGRGRWSQSSSPVLDRVIAGLMRTRSQLELFSVHHVQCADMRVEECRLSDESRSKWSIKICRLCGIVESSPTEWSNILLKCPLIRTILLPN